MMIPRIKGRVGQATEPPEVAGKWFFELFLTTLGGGTEMTPMGTFGPFDTELEAKTELKSAARMACEVIEKDISGTTSGKHIDMKTNEVRPWDEI
jgi:hypothetical protein